MASSIREHRKSTSRSFHFAHINDDVLSLYACLLGWLFPHRQPRRPFPHLPSHPVFLQQGALAGFTYDSVFNALVWKGGQGENIPKGLLYPECCENASYVSAHALKLIHNILVIYFYDWWGSRGLCCCGLSLKSYRCRTYNSMKALWF